VKLLLAKFELANKLFACVKNKGKNLATLNFALSNVVFCNVFLVETPFSSTCFGHVMSKVCQYATNEKKVSQCMKEVYLNDAQSIFQKLIIWTKKSSKGRQEWEVPCIETNLPP
jgi:hypothetical protein